MNCIKENLLEINNNISKAAERSGKGRQDILLIAVTKTRDPDEINQAISLGVTDIGENKVQELLEKYSEVAPVNWHLIGHLQTNKVKYIVDKVSMIHSVDSLKLAQEIEKRCASLSIKMDILLQVNPEKEESKFGVSKEGLRSLLKDILDTCSHIRVKGLMVIPPISENPEYTRNVFKEMRILLKSLEDIKNDNLELEYLSMGMSSDYEIAIEEGSNIVRIGTSIFGPRNY